MNNISISTVTPVYSGELYLEELILSLSRLREAWKERNAPFSLKESIFVIDNAIDDSEKVLHSLAENYPWMQVIVLSKNYGQHPATIAGLLHSSGDWVVTLDEDLQHRPDDIQLLLEAAVHKELDIVYAKPKDAVHKSRFRDGGSHIYKLIVSKVTGNTNIPIFNSFRLLRGSIGRAAASVCAHETYFDIALCWFTDRIGKVELKLEDKRYITTKKSGYTITHLIDHARRLFVSSQTTVLRLGALIGIVSMVFSSISGFTILIRKIISPETISVQGWTSLVLFVLFFGGLSSFLLGIIIEYIINLHLHAQGKPSFFIVNRESDKAISRFLDNQ